MLSVTSTTQAIALSEYPLRFSVQLHANGCDADSFRKTRNVFWLDGEQGMGPPGSRLLPEMMPLAEPRFSTGRPYFVQGAAKPFS